MIIRTWLQY